MEYVQMTLDDWAGMKQRLQQELINMKQSFVRTGYFLRKIEDSRGYELDGYKTLAEFAKAEYGLSPSSVSRFKALNKAYSVDGYSEMIDPAYMDYKKSMLEEMLTLPEEDRRLISPEAPREAIRDLKRHNEEAAALAEKEKTQESHELVEEKRTAEITAEEKTEPVAEEAAENAYDTLKENEPKKVRSIRDLVEEFYRANPDVVTEVFTSEAYTTGEVKKLVEIVNPSGNRTYKNGLWFMVMYENGVRIKEFAKAMQEIGWGEFFVLTQEIFVETASGADTYRNHFGALPETQEPPKPAHAEPAQPSEPKREKPVEKTPKSTKKPEKQPDESIEVEVVPGVNIEIEDIKKAQEAARLDMKKAEIEAVPTYTHEEDEPVENTVDNLPEEEIAPAQKLLKEPGTETILEDEETDKINQWKTAAHSAAEEVCQAMKNSAWSTAVTSARQLLHYLELVEHAEE